jgi:folate-dependent phosphoribosylglycinamide formyltransferase PurN
MRRLFEPKETPMKVALFMSGSGTNAIKILEHQKLLEKNSDAPYQVSLICTDNGKSNASSIAQRFGLPVKLRGLQEFYDGIGKDRKDLSQRPKYFELVLKDLQNFGIDAVALAGYMVLVTEPLLSTYRDRIFNVHPADLSIRDAQGKAVYVGAEAVKDAILAGQREIRATTHVVTAETDQGSPLLISKPVKVELPSGVSPEELRKPENQKLAKKIADAHQEKLKQVGDWQIYPLTIEWISRGYFGRDSDGTMRIADEALRMAKSYGLKVV